jgi:hypothetical protein
VKRRWRRWLFAAGVLYGAGTLIAVVGASASALGIVVGFATWGAWRMASYELGGASPSDWGVPAATES